MNNRLANPWSAEDFFARFPIIAQVLIGLEELLDMDSVFAEYPEELRCEAGDGIEFVDVFKADKWFEMDALLTHRFMPSVDGLRALIRPTWMQLSFQSLSTNIRDLAALAHRLPTAPKHVRWELAADFSDAVDNSITELDRQVDQHGAHALGSWGYYFFRRDVFGHTATEIAHACDSYVRMRPGTDSIIGQDEVSITVDSDSDSIRSRDGKTICRLPPQEFRFFRALWDNRGKYLHHADLLEAIDHPDNYTGAALKATKWRVVDQFKRDGLPGVARAIRAKAGSYGLFINH